MHPIINLSMVVEKETELERQGFRRTRRYIGDAPALIDERWYQTNANHLAETGPLPAVASEPRRQPAQLFFVRLFRRARATPRSPGSECCGETV